jgi:hypothetical protein
MLGLPPAVLRVDLGLDAIVPPREKGGESDMPKMGL